MIGKLRQILRALADAKVDFILVGGMSAVLRGATINTYDIDIVHARNKENLDRFIPVLEAFDAIFRMQPERRLRPAKSVLAGRGHLNLLTTAGNLDVLCTIGKNLTYEDLLPFSDELDLADGLRVRVLRLEKLIELKEELHRDKDVAVLPVLRHTLELSRKSAR
jgi:predicted nucleotidyltransferase